ncbi:MAG: helix-turn-helix transcriptional regulator [Hyphomonadaceae bacterium]
MRLSSRLPDPLEGEPVTLADHLVRCRKRRGLLQREAAALMGVCAESVSQWENGVMPADRLWPRVVAFLGYDPTPPAQTPGERLRAARRRRGLSIKALARAMLCDEETAAKWETRQASPGGEHSDALDRVLGWGWRAATSD